MLSTIVRLADAIQGHAGRSLASTYEHFDLKKLGEGVAITPAGEKSKRQINPNLAIAVDGPSVG